MGEKKLEIDDLPFFRSHLRRPVDFSSCAFIRPGRSLP
jgi:hypothetical protein